MALKAFILGSVLLALAAFCTVLGVEPDADFMKIAEGVGAVLVFFGGIFYLFDSSR